MADVGIDLGVRALEVRTGHEPRAPMTRTDHIHHVEIMLLDQPVQVHVDKVQSGRCSPVSEQPGFDMLKLQGFAQQRVVFQVDLPDRQIVGGAPPRVHLVQQVCRQGLHHTSTSKLYYT